MDRFEKYSGHTENWLEKMLFASRWLLAPFYLGLAASLIVLLIKFIGELAHPLFTLSPQPRAR